MNIPQGIIEPLLEPFNKAAYLQAQQAFYQWLDEVFNDFPIGQLVKARREFVDAMLVGLWQYVELEKDRNTTLIAVGGYGRGELHPYSDVDLLILSNGVLPPHTVVKLEQFITTLWDLKLDIGQSVRTIEDTLQKAAADITIATSLLEMRWLKGVKIYYKTLKKRLKDENSWDSKDFFIAKRDEQFQRHKKYNGVTYTLEPNLKANPGCLRDIQTISWITKHHLRYGKKISPDQLKPLTDEEYVELVEAQDALWNIRFALHLEAKRGENRLLFDYQAAVANRLGFGNHGKASVERMMKRLFRIIQRVVELNEMLLHHYQIEIIGEIQAPVIAIIDDNFQTADNLIQVRDSNTFFQRRNLLQLFVHIAENKHIKGIHSSTIRQLRQVRNRSIGELQDYEACQKLFIKIFKQPFGMLKAIKLMHKHAILAAYLPVWQQIVGQMQFDLFHAYTVDEHTIKVLQNCQAFFEKDNSDEFLLCNEIAKRFAKPQLLFLAAMFHDIAKGRGGSHSELGAIDANEFSARHQLSKYDTKLLSWLVKNHLLLSVTAQRKDIYDPEVIKEFAEQVRDETTLDYLYCLTVADVCATNDNLWNGWKASLFQDLYLFCQKALRRGLEKPLDIRAAVRDRRNDAQNLLLERGFEQQQITQLWHRFQANYFAHNSAEQICWHSTSILEQSDLDKPLIRISDTPIRGGTPIFIYFPIHEDIFVDVVSALDDKKLNVVDAQLMRSKNNYAMHTFVVLEKNGSTIETSSRIEKIQQSLEMALLGKRKKRFAPQRPSRKIKPFAVKPKIDFIATTHKNATTVEITALNVPGLLLRIGHIFKQHQLFIHAARIMTIGEKAEDMFVLSTNENTALDAQRQRDLADVISSSLNNPNLG
jgi:[protein-PII] uridylyltransferase